MPSPDALWNDVDEFFMQHLFPEDDALAAARERTRAAGLPPIEISAAAGRFLWLLCRIAGARRVLEIGTLGGYSTICFARAVGTGGDVTTCELESRHAEVARTNLEFAGVAERVEILVGPALDSLRALIRSSAGPYDVVFIDADKENNPHYLSAALELTRPGSLIITDNVVRDGSILDPDTTEAHVQGTRRLIEMLGEESRLEAAAFQTVGVKGWDGLAIARVI